MEKESYLGLNKPMLYIFMVFILSSFTYEMYHYNKLMAVTIAISFFIGLIMYKKCLVTIIIIVFFIISVINNWWFYSYVPKGKVEIRIDKIESYYGKGKIYGRNVNLMVDGKDLKTGDKILARGEFISNLNISKGIIGDYTVEDYKVLKTDLIYKLYGRREYIYKEVKEKLGTRKAGLITSLAFGYTDELDDDDREEMKSLGISHIISVSGLHMALVYAVLRWVLGYRLSLILLILYVIFTGAAPSALRAYIMILIMNLAPIVKRNYNSLSALSLAGIIILIYKPYNIFSLGFLLSFLATLGIILYGKDINKKLYKMPKSIRNTTALTLSAQIFTFPIIVLYFNECSLNFFLGNILMIPILNILVIMGNILVLVVKITPIFNYLLYLCHYIIKILDLLMEYTESIRIGTIYVNYTIAYFYISLLITYYFYKRGYKRFIYYPMVVLVYIMVLLYNPIPNIRYYREGGLYIGYKGEKVIIQIKENIDKDKLKSIAITDKIFTKVDKVNIGGDISINKSGKNFILKTKDQEYLLLVNYEKRDRECDIIDFIKGDMQEVWVFNNRIIARK